MTSLTCVNAHMCLLTGGAPNEQMHVMYSKDLYRTLQRANTHNSSFMITDIAADALGNGATAGMRCVFEILRRRFYICCSSCFINVADSQLPVFSSELLCLFCDAFLTHCLTFEPYMAHTRWTARLGATHS